MKIVILIKISHCYPCFKPFLDPQRVQTHFDTFAEIPNMKTIQSAHSVNIILTWVHLMPITLQKLKI